MAWTWSARLRIAGRSTGLTKPTGQNPPHPGPANGSGVRREKFDRKMRMLPPARRRLSCRGMEAHMMQAIEAMTKAAETSTRRPRHGLGGRPGARRALRRTLRLRGAHRPASSAGPAALRGGRTGAHVAFFDGPAEARAAGFRACRRCTPEATRTPVARAIERVRAHIDAHLDDRLTLDELAARGRAEPQPTCRRPSRPRSASRRATTCGCGAPSASRPKCGGPQRDRRALRGGLRIGQPALLGRERATRHDARRLQARWGGRDRPLHDGGVEARPPAGRRRPSAGSAPSSSATPTRRSKRRCARTTRAPSSSATIAA